jgi:hypothetical protein
LGLTDSYGLTVGGFALSLASAIALMLFLMYLGISASNETIYSDVVKDCLTITHYDNHVFGNGNTVQHLGTFCKETK